MTQNLKLRWAIIMAVLVLSIIWLVPNFVNVDKIWWPTKSKMVLGLDIQGGSHLVLKVDVEGALKQDATRLAGSMKTEIPEEAKVTPKAITVVNAARGEIQIDLNKAEDAEAIESTLNKFYQGTFRVVESAPDKMTVEFSEIYVRDFSSKLLDQAIATIRNRIDEFGVAEPSIAAQGTDRILVQLPGIKDASTAKELINRTARLDFMMVDLGTSVADLEKLVQDAEKEKGLKLGEIKYSQYVTQLNEALKGKIPENTVVYFEKPENAASMEVARIPFLLKLDEGVAGNRLSNAFVGGDQFGKPIVNFHLDALGARQFGDMTEKNTGKPMAIVLDKVVISAPTIKSRITDSGQITLGGGRDIKETLKEAKLISMALRAGSLPAALEQLEERTVGPSLGQDAIEKGKLATMIAAIGVFVFMILYYRTYGLIADIALVFNLLVTVAILSTLGATLTLPGVAGLALTLGISVDASVIIFERIKEELKKGATAAASVREGFDRAFSSIFDANVTSIAVCVVLMYYGTGPVRGFAITLLTGLVITMFTAIFFTRSVLDLVIGKWKRNLTLK